MRAKACSLSVPGLRTDHSFGFPLRSDLPSLLHFIRTQLDAPDFSQLPIELKQSWSDSIAAAMIDVPESYGDQLTSHAQELEAALLDYDDVLKRDYSHQASIRGFLTEVFGTEEELFKELPLMEKLPRALAVEHYVELRKKLRRWASRPVSEAPSSEGWFWPFLHQTTRPSESTYMEAAEPWGRAMWFETPDDLIDIRKAAEERHAAAQREMEAQLKERVAKKEKEDKENITRVLMYRARKAVRRRHEQKKQDERRARERAAQRTLMSLETAVDARGLRAAIAEAEVLADALPALQEATPGFRQKLKELEWRETPCGTAAAALAICVAGLRPEDSSAEHPGWFTLPAVGSYKLSEPPSVQFDEKPLEEAATTSAEHPSVAVSPQALLQGPSEEPLIRKSAPEPTSNQAALERARATRAKTAANDAIMSGQTHVGGTSSCASEVGCLVTAASESTSDEAAMPTNATEQGEKKQEDPLQPRRGSSRSRLAAAEQARRDEIGRLQAEAAVHEVEQEEREEREEQEEQEVQEEQVIVGAIAQFSAANELASQAGPENRPTSATMLPTDLMLLLDGMPEGTVEAAAAWCNAEGVESLAELREAEVEEDLIAALPLKPAKAKILRKRLKTTGSF
eukprot:Transcript_30687.p1 GENE.Transcript_30687~~Transcript_30687.p1  ORF type:complete len:628 (+),score=121.95 Transcript_30687:2817-4700(+)